MTAAERARGPRRARAVERRRRRRRGAGARRRVRARAPAGLRLHVGLDGRPRRVPEDGGAAAGRGASCWRGCGTSGPGPRVLATVPPHHLYGLLFGVLVPFMGGGSFVRTTPLHAETIAAQARSHQANVLVSVPAHLHAVAALPPDALPPLARIFSSGAPLDAGTAAAVTARAGRPVTEVLGSSETGGIAWRDSRRPDGAWAAVPGRHRRRRIPTTTPCSLRSPFAGGRQRGADDPWRRSDPRARRRTLRAARPRRRRRQDRRQPRGGRRGRTRCCARSRAWPTPPSSRWTRRRRAGTSCGRRSSRRR